MWILLLACIQDAPEVMPPEPQPTESSGGLADRFLRLLTFKVLEEETIPKSRASPHNPELLEPLPMPATLPYMVRTRGAPATLVDERSQVSMVMEAVGVRLEVEQLLDQKARVRCVGCRSETSGWIQRNVLQSTEYPGNLPNDALASFLEQTAHPATGDVAESLLLLDHGVVESIPGHWVSPPWHDEPGYTGPILEIHARPSGFSLVIREDETEPPR
ncbi:MAG: hypothetical protein VX519_11870 [Myxococcota bacterium]|nr:hypothetical protein [Myxococcota bacterium]